MKLLKLKITPLSSFSTFPKGDMIFGYFAYLLFQQGDKRLGNYLNDSPKIIISDFLPNGYLPKPTLPLDSFGVDDSEKKEFRKKNWIKIENLQNGKFEFEEFGFFSNYMNVRNSINRKTFSTDDSGVFAPYSLEEMRFLKQPVCYVLYNENYFDEKKILEVFEKMGKYGFGKKATIGKGQFRVEIENYSFKDINSKYYISLSPSFPTKKAYYNTFNRFGKYSYSNTPFKNPTILADTGAVIISDKKIEYIGKSLDNGIEKTSFIQGYSILIPFEFDGKGLKNG